MKLNCDLGEFQQNNDAEIMPYIDLANIACGFHGSDPLTITKTIKLAVQHHVIIGAHPSYADVENFGRKSMQLSHQALIATMVHQVGALQALCAIENTSIQYIKPHGALYNDMMKDLNVFEAICIATQYLNKHFAFTRRNSTPLHLMIQGLINLSAHQTIAAKYNVPLWYEAFADRSYQDNGLLVARTDANALLKSQREAVERCNALIKNQPLLSINNQELSLTIDTLCVHGDTPNALTMIKALRHTIDSTNGLKTSQ